MSPPNHSDRTYLRNLIVFATSGVKINHNNINNMFEISKDMVAANWEQLERGWKACLVAIIVAVLVLVLI